ncbi:hypothetical protein KDK95_16505 [Actinospica sp. MGRD01-02]|uniref:Guanylate cyclase domain-containing protein n=1 Tax=Actinospica acidithermotolerans TaxID=2828514 RepID=A0A941ECM3_9ACTN|nr:hypothetical protein [Actinospica acidithermotolerans]MBR7827920.1 hypothetical protein [Actinospica acidithermotolerans]
MSRSYRNRLCVVTDIEGYSSHPGSQHADAQRRLSQIMKFACRHAGYPWIRSEDRQDRGDGRLFLLPTQIDEMVAIPALVMGLRHGIYLANEAPGEFGRMRMRVSMARGAVTHGDTGLLGQAPITACRILDAEPVKRRLLETPSADIVLAVTDEIYKDVIRQEFPGLPSAGFSGIDVRVKEFHEPAWVHLPEAGPTLLRRADASWSAIAASAAIAPAAVGIGGAMHPDGEGWWTEDGDEVDGAWPDEGVGGHGDHAVCGEFGEGGGATAADWLGFGPGPDDGGDRGGAVGSDEVDGDTDGDQDGDTFDDYGAELVI